MGQACQARGITLEKSKRSRKQLFATAINFWHNFDNRWEIFTAMRRIFLSVLFWVPAFICISQPAGDPEVHLLTWNEFYKLQWQDFRGKPGEDARGDAGAVVQIKAKPFLVKKEIKYDVVALFNRNKSWTRGQSASLLEHEQLHFDLAELYARKIRKKIREMAKQGVDDVGTYNAAIEELLLESNQMDFQYDLETLHGALPKKQAAWAAKVKEELADLERYKKARRVIRGK